MPMGLWDVILIFLKKEENNNNIELMQNRAITILQKDKWNSRNFNDNDIK